MTNKLSTELMSPAERIAEACVILATGYLRSLEATKHPDPESGLDFSADQSGPDLKPENGAGR